MASDLRDQIPQQAYLNAQIIGRMKRTPAFAEAKKSVARSYGLESDALESYDLGLAHVVGALYCLIAVPKELLWENLTPEFLNSLKPKSYFQLQEKYQGQSEKDFLNHLRNSIAHVRFSITEDGPFIFWDADYRKSNEENFRATTDLERLAEFLENVGSSLANLLRRISSHGAGFIQ